ncbi:MAG: thiamine phosphate synthase [Magnetococcales bacterium]|nr:thiamine phosphate synthase [Magnetococcales bacterium]
MTTRLPITGIYPILDADWLTPTAFSPAAIASHLAQLPVSLVQLRAKGEDDAMAWEFMQLWMQALRTHAPTIRILLNDRLDWVEALGADGIHVGQEDASIAACRAVLPPERLIGLSTHTLAEIRQAETWQVDYIGFGPIFPTTTKQDTHAVQGVERLRSMVAQTRLPMVAIGGIDLEHLGSVAETQVASAALIRALWQGDWPQRLTSACRIWQERPAVCA